MIISPRILLVLLALVALSAHRARAYTINIICLKTPYPDLCASTLHASSKSQDASIPQLALIVVEKVESTVKSAYEKTKALEKSTKDPDLKSACGNCGTKYNTILTADVVASKESLTKGDFKYAVDYMTDSSKSLGMCEGFFKAGQSPVTAENTSGKQLSDVAAALTRTQLFE